MGSKLLPVKYPVITSYQHHAPALSIITTRDDYLPWFCGNFIQLRVVNNFNSRAWLDFYAFLYSETYQCPFLEFQHMNRNTIASFSSSIVQFLIESINNGYYAYFVIDGYFIALYPTYKKSKFPHPIFVYGYDPERKIFYVGDFFDGKFEFAEAAFDEMEQAYNHISPEDFSFEGVKLIRNKTEAKYHFDLPNVFELLGDYLFSRETQNRARAHYNIDPQVKVGMGHVYSRLKVDLENYIDDPEIFDYSTFHVLYEHKKVLSIILRYMKDQGYLEGDYDFSAVERKSVILRNLLIKYALTSESELPNAAILTLDELYRMEKEILLSVWEELSGMVIQDQGVGDR